MLADEEANLIMMQSGVLPLLDFIRFIRFDEFQIWCGQFRMVKPKKKIWFFYFLFSVLLNVIACLPAYRNCNHKIISNHLCICIGSLVLRHSFLFCLSHSLHLCINDHKLIHLEQIQFLQRGFMADDARN